MGFRSDRTNVINNNNNTSVMQYRDSVIIIVISTGDVDASVRSSFHHRGIRSGRLSPLRPVTAFVGDVVEPVHGAVAEIRRYSAHGDRTNETRTRRHARHGTYIV